MARADVPCKCDDLVQPSPLWGGSPPQAAGWGRRCRVPSPPPPARSARRPPHKGEGKTEYASRTVLIKSSCHAGTPHRSGAMLSGARPPVSPSSPGKVRGGEAPAGAGADRRTHGPPCGRARPPCREGPPADDASRHAFRRFTAAFSCGALRLSALAPGSRLRTGLLPAVQQAPCARIVVSVGRGPEASWERGYESRPQAPHPAPLK